MLRTHVRIMSSLSGDNGLPLRALINRKTQATSVGRCVTVIHGEIGTEFPIKSRCHDEKEECQQNCFPAYVQSFGNYVGLIV